MAEMLSAQVLSAEVSRQVRGAQVAIAQEQVQTAFNSVNNFTKEVKSDVGQFFSCNAACCGVEVEDDENHGQISAQWLRICVHHGLKMPKVSTYVEIICNPGLRNEQRFCSKAVPGACSPTYDFTVELPDFNPEGPQIQIRVMGSHIFPTEQGLASLTVQPLSTGVQVEELDLELTTMTGCCAAAPTAKLVVAWQLGKALDVRGDLSRAGTLEKNAMRRQAFTLKADLISLRLKHEISEKEQLWVKLFMLDQAGHEQVLIHSKGALSGENTKVLDFGDVGKLEIYESEIALANFEVKLEVWDRTNPTRQELIGEWKDPLSELRDLIYSRGLKLHFRAVLHRGLRNTGEATMFLDILDSSNSGLAHEDPSELAIPKRRGKNEVDKKDKFYLHVAYFGAAGRTFLSSPPFLKVFSAEGTKDSSYEFQETKGDSGSGICGEWTDAFKVTTKAGHSQVRIELWADPSETELLGQTIIYDAFASHTPCWRHIYGPSRAAWGGPFGWVKDHEAAEEMARGRRTPSCYHGSLFLTCDRFSGRIDALMSQMQGSMLPCAVTVRMFRAVYLDKYRNHSLVISVHIPGAPRLDFPASVNGEGVVGFLDDNWEEQQWVERCAACSSPEDISCAYVYIHSAREDAASASEMFGKIQLHFGDEMEAPHWSMLSTDLSVTSSQGSPGMVEGFLLGSVMVTRGNAGEVNKVESTAPKQTAPVYCHLDILAARNLPKSDEDGLADPCYEVRVEGLTFRLQDPARKTLNPTFLHRLVLGPIELPVDAAAGKLLANQSGLPPVLITIKDKDDASGWTGASVDYKILGSAALTNLQSLDVLDHGTGALDVNRCHQAVWYNLDGNGQMSFEHAQTFLVVKPRILVAAGYSARKEVLSESPSIGDEKDTAARLSQIGTEKWMKYNISLDLLGLRQLNVSRRSAEDRENAGAAAVMENLSHQLFGDAPQTQTFEICVMPFWEGAEQNFIPVQLDERRNCQGQKDPNRAAAFWRSLHPMVKWESQQNGQPPGLPTLPSSPSRRSADLSNLVVLHNADGRSYGWRVCISNYVAPIIPYLQRRFDKHVPQEPLQIPAGFQASRGDTVLLPDLVFSLRGRSEDGMLEELGSVCVMLPLSAQHLSLQLSQEVSKAVQTFRVKPVAHREQKSMTPKSSEGWIHHMVRAASGHRKETDTRCVGDKLLPHVDDLVEVKKRDPSGWTYGVLVADEALQGWFPEWWIPSEETDWMQECLHDFQGMDRSLQGLPQLHFGELRDDPFDIYLDVFAEMTGRLTWNDHFHVDKQLLQPHMFTIESDGFGQEGERVLQYFNPSDWMAGNPKHAEEAFDHRTMPSIYCHPNHSTASGRNELPHGPRHLWNKVLNPWAFHRIRTAKTKELKQLAKLSGFRLMSHQHRPEHDFGTSGSLSDNLHTFVRVVGHKIDPEKDRDSKFLARLTVGPAQRMTYKRQGPIQLEDTSGDLWRFSMEPTGLISSTKNGKFMIMVAPTSVELRPLSDQALAIDLSPEIQVDVPNDQRSNVQELMEMLKHSTPTDHEACTVMVVRFNQPGEVVWAPPKDVCQWFHPGEVLFVVKLQDTHDLVNVSIPSFDLRYPLETNWYPSKTLAGGREFRVPDTLPSVGSDGVVIQVEGPALVKKAATKKQKTKLKDKHVPEDGYSHSIHVTKHAFCCRIMKKAKTRPFDRARSNSWFRATLSEVCPDVSKLPVLEHQDFEFVRHMVLSKWTNVRRSVMGPDNKETAILKAHAQVQAVEEADSAADRRMEVAQNISPVERLWLHNSFVLNVYILTARGIQTPELREPYIKAYISGSDEEPQQVTARLVHDDDASCDFYHRISFDLMLPGDGTLVLQLWAKPMISLGDQLVGEAYVDLEDRQMALLYKRLRSASNSEWIHGRLSPQELVEVEHHQHHEQVRTWHDPTKVYYRHHVSSSDVRKIQSHHGRLEQYPPHLAPPEPAPMEAVQLYVDAAARRSKVGTLRTWMDLFTSEERVPEVDFSSLREIPMPLQVQIKIFQVDGISVYKDFGERNDVFVQGDLKYVPVGKQESHTRLKTDVHKYAHTTASFNYSWTFDLEAPVRECYVELQLLDQDTVSGADLIYAPKTLSLEPLIAATYWARTYRKQEPQEVHHEVIFDCYPPGHKLRAHPRCSLRCCRRRNTPQTLLGLQPWPATLSMSIEVTVRDGMALPARTEQFAEPKDRVDLKELMLRPNKAFRIILGPTNLRVFQHAAFWCGFLLVMLLVLAVAWLFIHVFVVPLK